MKTKTFKITGTLALGTFLAVFWIQIVSAQSAPSSQDIIADLKKQIQELKMEIKALSLELKVIKQTSVFGRTLKKGYSGEDVKRLQEFLQSTGVYPEALITGYFGNFTEEALKRYQIKEKIKTTGVMDENTHVRIFAQIAANINGLAAMPDQSPRITDAVLSDNITESGKTAAPSTRFASTTPDIYAILYLDNIKQDTPLAYIRFYRDAYVDSGVSHPSADNVPYFHFQWSLKPGNTRPAGDYKIIFYVNGKKSKEIRYAIF